MFPHRHIIVLTMLSLFILVSKCDDYDTEKVLFKTGKNESIMIVEGSPTRKYEIMSREIALRSVRRLAKFSSDLFVNIKDWLKSIQNIGDIGKVWHQLQISLRRFSINARASLITFMNEEHRCVARSICEFADHAGTHLPSPAKQLLLIFLTSHQGDNVFVRSIANGLISSDSCEILYRSCDKNKFFDSIELFNATIPKVIGLDWPAQDPAQQQEKVKKFNNHNEEQEVKKVWQILGHMLAPGDPGKKNTQALTR